MYIGISKDISDEHFCKAVMHPKNLAPSLSENASCIRLIWQSSVSTDLTNLKWFRSNFSSAVTLFAWSRSHQNYQIAQSEKDEIFSFNTAGAGSHSLRMVRKIKLVVTYFLLSARETEKGHIIFVVNQWEIDRGHIISWSCPSSSVKQCKLY